MRNLVVSAILLLSTTSGAFSQDTVKEVFLNSRASWEENVHKLMLLSAERIQNEQEKISINSGRFLKLLKLTAIMNNYQALAKEVSKTYNSSIKKASIEAAIYVAQKGNKLKPNDPDWLLIEGHGAVTDYYKEKLEKSLKTWLSSRVDSYVKDIFSKYKTFINSPMMNGLLDIKSYDQLKEKFIEDTTQTTFKLLKATEEYLYNHPDDTKDSELQKILKVAAMFSL